MTRWQILEHLAGDAWQLIDTCDGDTLGVAAVRYFDGRTPAPLTGLDALRVDLALGDRDPAGFTVRVDDGVYRLIPAEPPTLADRLDRDALAAMDWIESEGMLP